MDHSVSRNQIADTSQSDKIEAQKPSTGAPGFGAIVGLLIVVYLVKRRKR